MEKNETLREYLDRIHITSGDNSCLVITNPINGMEMQVSRRYIESSAFKQLLDYEIIEIIYPYYNIYGQETIKFILKDKESK